ncbi:MULTISPECIES: DUF943 family protein [Enterobacterales]|uniref:DUF943 family protein n=1 Tax=Enterobacterales TaxID=91347 RepID=UPI0011E3EC36|nr:MULTISPECIES: DUF943 family protein [Enterobacterales]MCW7560748.1 DUF943 family protein [Serratia marcescens]MCW7565537.1 DUF943 family protein [Serratia marcescens]MCW7570576.1 DUF943 family protein [Serratia marcescens]MCW7575753.1 DUF943 family protein [Serratia marcescens]MCW7580538.1 DUF943 family protein [Serratia marcescens]
MFKYKRTVAIVIFLIIAYCIWIAVRPAKIIRVDKGAVFVEHLPMTTEGKLKWWMNNKELLQQKYHVINKQYNFTVTIMNFNGYEELPKGVRDGSIDDYTCFDDTNQKHEKCVYNNIAIIIRGNLDGKQFINIDGKTYTQTQDGKVELK